MTTGLDKALLRQLLWISGAWEISDYQIDMRKQRCDVWVGPKVERGWFGRAKAPPPRTESHIWQHVALGPLGFVIHAAIPAGVDLSKLPWTGDRGMPFTHALAQQVFHLFNEGMELPAICKMLHLSLNDVWRYRFAIDHGLVQSDGVTAKQAATAPNAASVAAADTPAAAARAAVAAPVGADGVPDVTDPVWLQLAEGELKLDIKVLSLKLMLTKVRSQFEVISDDEVRMLKLRDLHRYFVKNARMLDHELAQLKAG